MAVPDHVRQLLSNRATRIALVGASNATHKYGNIILKDLRSRGYEVLPVNSRGAVIDGMRGFRDVASIGAPVDIINVVVPPERALDVVHRTDPAHCDVIWFQPGSFDRRVVAAAEARFGTVIAGDCIMVVARQT